MVYTGRRQRGKKPGLVFDDTRGKDMEKGFTLILCWSRLWCFNRFFSSFEKMRIPLKDCNLLIIDNSNNTDLRDALVSRAGEYSGVFRSVRVFKTWREYQRPLLTSQKITWKTCQNGPIVGMHKDALRLCTTERFVMIEDDTLCPRDAVQRLLSLLDNNKNCGMATAIQAMRQSAAFNPTYTGIYYVEREGDKILEMVTPSPRSRGVHKVDASGWYCFASYKSVFLEATSMLEEADDETRNFAVDVLHVNNIRQLGYDILADFGLWCGHMSKMDGGIFNWGKNQCLPMISAWSEKWKCYLKSNQLRDPVHYRLIRNMTRKKDRSGT